MTRTERKLLGDLTDIATVEALVEIAGRRFIDVGCGPGNASRELARRGATVLGVEPDPIQADLNRKAEPEPGVTFAEARAEALPVENGSADGVFLFRSLHHVPADHMDDALREAARALTVDGFLYVVEPAVTGTHFPVMRPFNDETTVRAQAQAALARTAATLFARHDYFEYLQRPRYASFEAMVTRVTGRTFNSIRREDVDRPDVRRMFETGRTGEGDYAFEQPILVNLYRDKK